MIIVGLTGGIGSGKTTVAKFFHALGVPVYIADEEAKKLMLSQPVKKEIIAIWGEESYFPSGKLNRKYLASRVFNDEEQLSKLNNIVHPRVEEHFQNWVKHQSAHFVIYEAAILFETGKYKEVDYSILVTAPKEIRVARLKKRDRASEEQIKARMKNQWSDERKEKLADWCLENTDLAQTQQETSKLYKQILNL